MHDTLRISSLRFSPARATEDGKLGFVSFKVGALILDGVTVRRTATGYISLSFPERVDRAGVAHPIVRPLDQDVRERIERRVFTELRSRGLIP